VAVRLDAERHSSIADQLPPDTVEFLQGCGLPDSLTLMGFEHVFALDMEPVLDGTAFRVGTVNWRWCLKTIAIQRTTGHVGYVCDFQGVPPWDPCNSSIANFVQCCAACDDLWELQRNDRIAYECRADWLWDRIRDIDQDVLNRDSIWAELIAEIRWDVV